ncbi:MAG: hypothetical protein ACK5NT_06580 [Pyrinomonadaceae bacterium]
MGEEELSELYIVAGMMVLCLIIASITIYFFLKTYYKEKSEREKELAEKLRAKEKTKQLEKENNAQKPTIIESDGANNN